MGALVARVWALSEFGELFVLDDACDGDGRAGAGVIGNETKGSKTELRDCAVEFCKPV